MPEFDKKISVIIPAYNIEDLLGRCVESVVYQDYPKNLLEIIVVDDGSTDATGKVADELGVEFYSKRLPVCAFLQVISMITYTRYLFGATVTYLWPLTVAMLAIILTVGYDLYKQMQIPEEVNA